MLYKLRFPLIVMALATCAACQTHDRRMYSNSRRPEKNVRVPNPWAPSTSKAADEATASAVGAPLGPANTPNSATPGSPPPPLAPQ